MDFEIINQRGLVLIGCGHMGAGLLVRWLESGLELKATTVLDPHPSDWLVGQSELGLSLNVMTSEPPAVIVLATKPQLIPDALAKLDTNRFSDTLFLSIAAGATIASVERLLSPQHPIVRSMPNTPATIGEGASAYIGNAASKNSLSIAETLLSSIGLAFELESETQMDAVTALSGSGPAYLFQMAESMALAGERLGLSKELSMALAKQTILGAGQLMSQSSKTPEELRQAVTSPAGTTQSALNVLKSKTTGLDCLLLEATKAAYDRSIEIGAGPV
jgi:pyrroline-5-carboxylate reductase